VRARTSAPFVVLCLLCFVLYAPGLSSIPPLDRDEARFAQATRQMLETGDFIRIHFQDEERNKKPIGIHWLQAASVALLSTSESNAIWPYRLPSALAASAAVLATFWFGARLLFSPIAGFVAAILMASALVLIAEAHLATTDAPLLAVIVVGQGALGLVYIASRAARPVSGALIIAFWLAEAAGILLKGPPAPLLALLTVVSLAIIDRDLRWITRLRPVAGLVLMGAVVAPWVVAIEGATAGRFLADSIAHDLLPKLVGAHESHGAPPGCHLLLTLVGFWPGSLFLVPALIWGWQRRRLPAQQFLLAWLVPAWVLCELVPTKLPHYVLPLYPALALLAGSALVDGSATRLAGWARVLDIGIALLWGAVTAALAAVLVLLPMRFGSGIAAGSLAAAMVLLALALLLWCCPRRSDFATPLMAALAVAFVLPAAIVVVPGADALWLSRSAAMLVGRYPARRGDAVLSVGYSEPSLVFLLGTATRLVTAAPGEGQLAGAGMALVSDRYDAEFRRSLAAHGLSARALDHVEGLDYSVGGDNLRLTLYDLAPD
jgi:4-amino-4-deoxy-L-arabinose transferase-like glycosyltransferase